MQRIMNTPLKYGADINSQDNNKWTPLHFASKEGHKQVVEFLLKQGADLNIKDKHGKTPFHLRKLLVKYTCE